MKHDCDMIRDLMPLCMDDTASQASRRAVLEHTAECGACQRIFEEMKQALPEEERPDDLRPEVRLIRRARHFRRWRRVAALLLAVVVAVSGAFELQDRMQHYWSRPLDEDEYRMSISRRENGDVVFLIRQNVPYQMNIGSQFDAVEGVLNYIPYVALWPKRIAEENMHLIERLDNYVWVEGEGMYSEQLKWDETLRQAANPIERERTLITEIWSNGTLIYQHGDDVPLASPELEAYMVNYDEMYMSRAEYWQDQEQWALNRAEYHTALATRQPLWAEQAELKPMLPELQ